MSMVWGILWLVGLGITLMIAIRLYKKYRTKS
jgi:putative membrane protein